MQTHAAVPFGSPNLQLINTKIKGSVCSNDVMCTL